MSVFEIERPAHFTTQNVPDAINKAMSMAGSEDLICVTGSLYVVAEARTYVMQEEAKPSAQSYNRD